MTTQRLRGPRTLRALVPEQPLLAPATRVWLAWSGLSTVVAVAASYAVGILIRASIETGVVLFGVGMAWSAATPVVLRAIGRRLNG